MACACTSAPYPGHIDPAKVAQELPAFVKRVRSHGLRVTQIKGPAIRTSPSRNAEAIIGAAAQAGLTHYSLGGYTYDLKKPLAPQLDAIKLRLEKFVRLNQKHKIKLVYDTAPGRRRGRRRGARSAAGHEDVRSADTSASTGTPATWRCTATACGKR